MLAADVAKQAKIVVVVVDNTPLLYHQAGVGSLVDHNQGTGLCARFVQLNLTQQSKLGGCDDGDRIDGPADCNSIPNQIAVS